MYILTEFFFASNLNICDNSCFTVNSNNAVKILGVLVVRIHLSSNNDNHH